jgi:hypothetical protein
MAAVGLFGLCGRHCQLASVGMHSVSHPAGCLAPLLLLQDVVVIGSGIGGKRRSQAPRRPLLRSHPPLAAAVAARLCASAHTTHACTHPPTPPPPPPHTHTQACAAPPCRRGTARASPRVTACGSAFPHPSPQSCMPAGLCCAALLARYGMRVSVCESHYLPGGAAHSFEVAGHSFDAGPSFFAGIAGGPIWEHARLLSQFGPARVRQQSPSIPAFAAPSGWTMWSTGPRCPKPLAVVHWSPPRSAVLALHARARRGRCLDLRCPQGRWAPPPLIR